MEVVEQLDSKKNIFQNIIRNYLYFLTVNITTVTLFGVTLK